MAALHPKFLAQAAHSNTSPLSLRRSPVRPESAGIHALLHKPLPPPAVPAAPAVFSPIYCPCTSPERSLLRFDPDTGRPERFHISSRVFGSASVEDTKLDLWYPDNRQTVECVTAYASFYPMVTYYLNRLVKMQAAFEAFRKEALQRKRAIKTEKASPKDFTDWLYRQSRILTDLLDKS